ncbi:T9SS type A sorting domain-containing protein [bacterium SCSIO 12741]|nr:T9SS type A sorting domain-containing protein [bacterium SCSIO 12741]
MKNLLFSIFTLTALIFTGLSANAQQSDFSPLVNYGENQEAIPSSQLPLPAVHGMQAAGDTQEVWLNYGRAIYNQGGSRSYFRNYLYPDSTVQVEFSSGYGAVWKHSFGEVFDPKSIYFKLDLVNLNDTSRYTVDSVAYFYRYFRWNDQAPDTLRIQFYDRTKIRSRHDPGWQSGASYANVDYDYQIRKGSDPSYEITYLLDNKDTAMFAGQRRLAFDVNLPFDTGLFASTISFFPGHQDGIDDTIDVYIDPLATNRVNAFLVYEFRDEVPNVLAGEYNNGLVVTQSVRYDYNSNGWRDRYQPGTAWASASGIYHTDMEFKLIYTELGSGGGGNPGSVGEYNLDDQITLFPQPAQGYFEFRNNSGKSIATLNLTAVDGKWSKTIDLSSTSEKIDISDLPAGLYLVEGSDQNGYFFRKKLVVQ